MNALFRRIDRSLKGDLGACVIDLTSGEVHGHRQDETFPTASVVKIQIMMALLEKAKRERLNLLRLTVRLRPRDIVRGSGILRDMTPGVELPLNDLCVLMIVLSDNTATNMLIDYVGLKAINARIAEWGYPGTRVWRKINFDRKETDPRWFGESTPGETADLLARVARREFLGPKWDALAEDILLRQRYDTALPRLLPGSGDFGPNTPPEIRVAHKTGSIEGVRADAGIITAPFGRYVIAGWTRNLEDDRYHPDNAGVLAIAKLSRGVYDELEKRAAKRG